MQEARLDDDVLDSIEVAAFTAGPTGTVTRWNPSAERLFGVARDDAVGRPAGEVLQPLLQGDDAPGLIAAIRVPVAREGEVIVPGPDDPTTCAVKISVMEDAPLPRGTVVLALDVTERARTERRLAAQYAAARVLAEAETVEEVAPALLRGLATSVGWDVGTIWAVDEDAGRLRLVDLWHHPAVPAAQFKAFSRGLSFRRGEGLPGHVWEAAAPIWIEDVSSDPSFPRGSAAAEAGLTSGMAFPLHLRERVLGVVELFSRDRVRRDDDLLEAMDAVGNQVGQFLDRARAAEALRDREARRSAILEAALDAIVAMDHEGRVTEFNPAAERMFGYRRDEAVGRELAELIIPPARRDEHRRAVARYLRTGEGTILGRRIELTAMRADGTEFPIELAVTRVAVPGPPAFKGFVRDLTEREAADRALRESEERLQQALAAGSMGVWEWDITTDEVRWSDSLEQLHGLEPGTFAGTFEAFAARIHPDDRTLVMSEITRAVREGSSYRAQYRLTGEGGPPRWVESRGRVEHNPSGEAVRMTGLSADITERRRADELRLSLLERERAAREQAEAARERLAFLADASSILSTSLNQERTLEKIANLAVPRLADWCVVYLSDGDVIDRVTMAHVDPSRADIVEEIRQCRLDPRALEGVPAVLRGGEARLLSDATAQDLAVDVDEPERLARVLEPLSVRSWMCVPLRARGRILGAISFISAESGRRFGTDDLALAEELCRHAALAADNARLYEERSHVARTLQRSLLPASLPEVPGVAVAARYEAAGEIMRVGGDFYDLFDGPGGWYVVVGDVQGKGPEAAALTGLARHTARAAAADGRPPSEVLAAVNDAVSREGTERFCTVVCVKLTREEEAFRVVVSCGGHPLPRLLRQGGGVEALGRHGTLLGLFDDPELHDRDSLMRRGDALVLFTDGVIESRPDGDISLDGFLASLAGKDAEGLAMGVEGWARDASPDGLRDDIAIMVLRVEDVAGPPEGPAA